MKNKIITLLFLFASAGLHSGCDSWLDVTPQAQVNADKLFSTPTGFENALYGIYTSMTDPALYGTHATFGLMDVLAQYYRVHTNRYHTLYEASLYNYGHAQSQEVIRQAWLKAYNSIANCNILLEYLSGKPASFFEGDKYLFLQAETRALRGYLHFDLLRAFAPSWKENPDAVCLPYAGSFAEKIHRQRSTREIVGEILRELEEARSLLKPVDPALQERFKDMYNHYQSSSGQEFVSYRAYRLNYWAITGLMARVCHYSGDTGKAYEYAREVIRAGEEGFFLFAQESGVSAPLTSRDVVMQTEILFALNFPGIHNLWYGYDAGSSTSYTINTLASVYPLSDDFRRQYLVIKNGNGEDVSVKYADVKSTKGGKIPMIRLSEMYLIAAEAGFDTHRGEAIGYLETLRKNRGVVSGISPSVTSDEFLRELTLEARREFLGEGQLFYWYKRLGSPIHQGNTTIVLDPVQFCLPLPAAEVEFGDRKEDYINQLK